LKEDCKKKDEILSKIEKELKEISSILCPSRHDQETAKVNKLYTKLLSLPVSEMLNI
jgi:hypothetical protein